MFVTVAFAIFIVAGWLLFAYIAFATPAGLGGLWDSVRALPLIVQLVVWLLFLPWMLALWVYHSAWPLWLRIVIILGLVWATWSMAVPPLIQALRSR
jgi:hypothetical protein